MKKIGLSVLFSCAIFLGFSQEVVFSNQSENVSTLMYEPEIPNADTYFIKLNKTGKEVPNEILLQINSYRRTDTDFLWRVNEKLEILIYKFNTSIPVKSIVD